MLIRTMRRSFSLVVLALMLAGLARAVETTAEPTSIRFFAYDWSKQRHIMAVRDVKCLALRPEGVEVLGSTDKSGEVLVSYDRIFRAGNLALLFCSSGSEVQCASIRLDVPHLCGFAEYNIRVTPHEIIDR